MVVNIPKWASFHDLDFKFRPVACEDLQAPELPNLQHLAGTWQPMKRHPLLSGAVVPAWLGRFQLLDGSFQIPVTLNPKTYILTPKSRPSSELQPRDFECRTSPTSSTAAPSTAYRQSAEFAHLHVWETHSYVLYIFGLFNSCGEPYITNLAVHRSNLVLVVAFV